MWKVNKKLEEHLVNFEVKKREVQGKSREQYKEVLKGYNCFWKYNTRVCEYYRSLQMKILQLCVLDAGMQG